MIEAKYYKDYRHNYMILQCGQQDLARSYQYRILTSDKIREILRCCVRHVNATTYYYYDISSRTTLESLYKGKKMSYEQVKDVLRQIYGICDRLAGYFMDERKLVLLPEHIYYDFTNDKYIGLYYPDYQAEGAEAIKPLMDFFLEHIDTEDIRLTETMYRICEMAEEPHFMIEDALQILDERQEEDSVMAAEASTFTKSMRPLEKDETASVGRGETARCDQEASYSHKEFMERQRCAAYDEMSEQWEENELPEKVIAPSRRDEEHSTKARLFYFVFSVLSLFSIGGALAVYNIYDLTGEEELALYGVMAAMVICFFICVVKILRVWQDEEKDSKEKESSREHFTDTEENMDWETGVEVEKISLDQVISQDPVLAVSERGNEGSRYPRPDTVREEENYGNTIFFDKSMIEEGKLYAIDQKNKRHIELKQFPYTIGKAAGCVDCVLSDRSVSRIHARFDKDGEKLLLTDMNSTNGTYKNGLRMQPRETVEIEPGDEIRFGSLNYCYR